MGVTDGPERLVRWFDDRQQERTWLAHPLGVIRKYADDRGSAFAGLVTFQLFLGLLPLLVVVLTVFGGIIQGSEDIREAVLDSTLAQAPVVGREIRENLDGLTVSGPWVAISIAGLLWTATGIYNSMQLALNQVWNVTGIRRQGFVSRLLRATLLFVLIVAAAISSSLVRSAAGGWMSPAVLDVVAPIASTLLSMVLLAVVFRLVVSGEVPLVRLASAAVLAGLLWQLLQSIGTWIVARQLVEARDLYGALGTVVVVLLWVNLLARSAVFANEWAVVSWRGLWPRRIAQPPLTEADREVLRGLVNNEHRRPEEHIRVWFDEDADRDPRADAR